MNKGALKKFFKNFWFIVWKDESFKGWVFSIIFLLIVIKFIFFPVLNFASGTSLPLVIVESCSMYHEGNIFSNFDNWWEVHDLKYFQEKIIKTKFLNFPFKNGLNKGDILFVIGIKPEKVKIGDEVVLIGRQGREFIGADEMAKRIGTISYEVLTRINPLIFRTVI